MKYDVTACIVTYHNDSTELLKAANSFLRTKLKKRLYIVDNSKDDNLRQVFQNLQDTEYIFMNSNNGFGYAHNVILSDSEKMGRYHLVLNPDIYFDEGVIESLTEYMDKNPNVGNVMPKITFPDGRFQYLCKLLPTPMNWFVRMFIPFKSVKEQYNERFEMRFADFDQEFNVPYLSGCFMFLRKSVIEEIGVFDTHIFMYGEDTDLNRRIHQKYKTMYYPKVCVTHAYEGGSHKKLRLLWIHIKAAVYYLNKWGWFFDKERVAINRAAFENAPKAK